MQFFVAFIWIMAVLSTIFSYYHFRIHMLKIKRCVTGQVIDLIPNIIPKPWVEEGAANNKTLLLKWDPDEAKQDVWEPTPDHLENDDVLIKEKDISPPIAPQPRSDPNMISSQKTQKSYRAFHFSFVPTVAEIMAHATLPKKKIIAMQDHRNACGQYGPEYRDMVTVKRSHARRALAMNMGQTQDFYANRLTPKNDCETLNSTYSVTKNVKNVRPSGKFAYPKKKAAVTAVKKAAEIVAEKKASKQKFKKVKKVSHQHVEETQYTLDEVTAASSRHEKTPVVQEDTQSCDRKRTQSNNSHKMSKSFKTTKSGKSSRDRRPVHVKLSFIPE